MAQLKRIEASAKVSSIVDFKFNCQAFGHRHFFQTEESLDKKCLTKSFATRCEISNRASVKGPLSSLIEVQSVGFLAAHS